MLFGVLSAIAFGIGVTAAAQDLIDENAVNRLDEPAVQIQEIRRDAGSENVASDL